MLLAVGLSHLVFLLTGIVVGGSIALVVLALLAASSRLDEIIADEERPRP